MRASYRHLGDHAEHELGPVRRGLVPGLAQEVPCLQGLARLESLGGRDLPPDLGSLVRLACVGQLPSLLERPPRLMQGAGSLWHPLVERGVTVDELAEFPGSAGHIAGASFHASTIAGGDAPANAQITRFCTRCKLIT